MKDSGEGSSGVAPRSVQSTQIGPNDDTFMERALASRARARAIKTAVYVAAEVVLEKLSAARDAAKRRGG